MERARCCGIAGQHAARRIAAIGADRQADQCRISHRNLDPAGQHHERRAWHASRAASACDRIGTAAGATSGLGDGFCGAGRQKAARAKIGTCAGDFSGTRADARGGE